MVLYGRERGEGGVSGTVWKGERGGGTVWKGERGGRGEWYCMEGREGREG